MIWQQLSHYPFYQRGIRHIFQTQYYGSAGLSMTLAVVLFELVAWTWVMPFSERLGEGIAYLLTKAGPLAMVAIAFLNLVIHFLQKCLGWLKHILVGTQPLPKWVAHFSIAGLFLGTAVPYTHYPLSCCLLE